MGCPEPQHLIACLQASIAEKGLWESWGDREELHEQASALTQCRHCRKLLWGTMAGSIPDSAVGQAGVPRAADRRLWKGFSPRCAPWVSEGG